MRFCVQCVWITIKKEELGCSLYFGVKISSTANRQLQAEEPKKDTEKGKNIVETRIWQLVFFSCAFYSRFFEVPALSSDSEGAVVRIHSGYAVPSSTNDCHNILPMACTLKA